MLRLGFEQQSVEGIKICSKIGFPNSVGSMKAGCRSWMLENYEPVPSNKFAYFISGLNHIAHCSHLKLTSLLDFVNLKIHLIKEYFIFKILENVWQLVYMAFMSSMTSECHFCLRMVLHKCGRLVHYFDIVQLVFLIHSIFHGLRSIYIILPIIFICGNKLNMWTGLNGRDTWSCGRLCFWFLWPFRCCYTQTLVLCNRLAGMYFLFYSML
jgi:hypothetical protein